MRRMLCTAQISLVLLVGSDVAAPRPVQAHQLYCSITYWDLTLESITVDGADTAAPSSEAAVWNESGRVRWDGHLVLLHEMNAVYVALTFEPEGG